jgi:hypothetical protein
VEQENGRGILHPRNSNAPPTLPGWWMQLKYSSERIIFWANFNFSLNWYNQLRLYTAENDQIYGLLYFGYRFDAPGFAGKTMDWLYGKQP